MTYTRGGGGFWDLKSGARGKGGACRDQRGRGESDIRYREFRGAITDREEKKTSGLQCHKKKRGGVSRMSKGKMRGML